MLNLLRQYENLFLSRYREEAEEIRQQARALLISLHILTVLFISLIFLTPQILIVKILLLAMSGLGLVTLILLRFGQLNVVNGVLVGGMGFMASYIVFTRPEYQTYESYMLAAIHLSLLVVSGLLTYNIRIVYFTMFHGIIWVAVNYWMRAINPALPGDAAELDDYVAAIAMLALAGFITSNVIQLRTRLLETAEKNRVLAEDRARQIEKNLGEKEILLKEVHHRVKNNLNIIVSLLRLKMHELDPDSAGQAALMDSVNRIYSMAMVHESLYQTDTLAEMDFGPYITSLADAVVQSLGRTDIDFRFETEEIILDIQRAIPCGLILNELISNVCKHAFQPGEQGQANITMGVQNNQIVLEVKDTGKRARATSFSESDSLGFQLMVLLTEQLGGNLTTSVQNGTSITIRFPRESV